MEAEKKIEELKRLGEADGADLDEIDEKSYWQGFLDSWESGFQQGFSEGLVKAAQDLNMKTS